MDIIDDFVEDQVEESFDFSGESQSDESVTVIDSVSDNEILYVVSDNGVTKDDFYILINEVRGLREDVQNKQYQHSKN